MSGKVWSLLAITGQRQYAGNEGYSDDPARLYRYDSTVGNSRHISQGDLAAVRNTAGLIGIGLIASVITEPGEKQRFRCPVCKTTSIKKRQEKSPSYRCADGHEFDEPNIEATSVTQYEASYGDSWIALPGIMNASELRAVTPGAGTQNSIREVDPARFAGTLATRAPLSQSLLAAFLQKSLPDTLNESALPQDGYVPSFEDRRVTILRSIRARRGQAQFRSGLIERYGARCMISGCDIMQIVEAAHIWPYRGDEDHAMSNGLLLRSDLHTLFDYDLIGIHPDTLSVRIGASLAQSAYSPFDGVKINAGSHQPNSEALGLRWAAFKDAEQITDDFLT
jgi:putative restriction endonuclease